MNPECTLAISPESPNAFTVVHECISQILLDISKSITRKNNSDKEGRDKYGKKSGGAAETSSQNGEKVAKRRAEAEGEKPKCIRK